MLPEETDSKLLQRYVGGSQPAFAQLVERHLAPVYSAALRQVGGLTDYGNVPDSFSFTPIDGHPALSYFATYTQGDTVQTEYFIRVQGQQGYVMFFTNGQLEDVRAAMPQIQAMARSLKVP